MQARAEQDRSGKEDELNSRTRREAHGESAREEAGVGDRRRYLDTADDLNKKERKDQRGKEREVSGTTEISQTAQPKA
eukprot:1606816-Rhodomonas_salina.2